MIVNRIYLDCCCYSRPFDDQSQDRIYLESEAILAILKEVDNGIGKILGSTILEMEISNISNEIKKQKIKDLYTIASENIVYNNKIKKRAKEIMEKSSVRTMDSLHIASAEYGEAQVLLTTDYKLIRACSILNLTIKIQNPILYLLGDEKT